MIPDPNLGTNVLSCRWVEETLWYYRRTFEASKPKEGERAWLVFESLDLAAKVCLNGMKIGTHANSSYPCQIEVTDGLREGTNELVVELDSGLFFAMHQSAEGLGLRLNHQLTKVPLLPKSQSQHGWD